jgi:hypothetical protein
VKKRVSFGVKLGLPRHQAEALARLRTPSQIQDYIASLRINFEPQGDTCLSVTEAMRQGHAHCIEGAFIAACALWMGGEAPLLMDMQAKGGDDDHVVALYRRANSWGAISKSNHIWLRWRDPIYRTLRELALSYFHEYVTGNSKTLWAYSRAFDLRRFDPAGWVVGSDCCWDVAGALDQTRHYPLLTLRQYRALRARDAIEVEAGKHVQFKAPIRKLAARY